MVCLLCDFKILLTVFNQSYSCQTSHYLGRNQLPKPFLILHSLGTFDSFLTGQGRNHVYSACCSVQTDHKPVSTSSEKVLRGYSYNIYTMLVNFCFALVSLTYLEKDPSRKVSQRETKEVTELEEQK